MAAGTERRESEDAERRVVTPAKLAAAAALFTAGWSLVAAVRGRSGDVFFLAVAALIVILAFVGRRAAPSGIGWSPLADRAAHFVAVVGVAVAVITAIGWAALGQDGADGVGAAAAVLILICPGGLALAAPMAFRAAVVRAAELDVTLEDAAVLERVAAVGSVVVMKRGTLTRGQVTLTSVMVGPEADAGLTSDAARIETAADHPVAAAIAGSSPADDRSGGPRIDDVRVVEGRGISGTVDGRPITVGHPRLFTEVAESVAEQVRGVGPGTIVAYAGRRGRADAAFVLTDPVREQAAASVAALGRGDVRTVLLTGDATPAADALAAELGFDDVVAEAGAVEKLAVSDAVRIDGRPVAVVGDGIAHAAALATADLAIAFGGDGGRAPIRVEGDDLGRVGDVLSLGRATRSTVLANLRWATGVHAAMVPVAATGRLSPGLAAVTMGLSAALVVLNSRRLRRFRRTRR